MNEQAARLRAQIVRTLKNLSKLQKGLGKAEVPQDEKQKRLVATINVR